MKNNIMILVRVVITALFFTVVHDNLIGSQKDSYHRATRQKERKVSQRNKRKKAPVESQESMIQESEPPIENMQAFVNEYDHIGKQKTVETLLQRGIEFCKNHDLRTVCHAFTHTKEFIDGALYIFLLDTKGVVYAHGNQPDLIWKNLWNKKDMFGAYIVQSMIQVAHKGGGTLTYEWDGAVKVSLLQQVDIEGKQFVIGCGYFPHSKEYAAIGLVKGAVALFNKDIAEGHDVDTPFGVMSYALSSQFLFGDLYLFALDFEGKIYAQGERPKLVGSPALDYLDASGKKYNAEIIELLKTKEEGEGVWVDYISKKALKRAYAEKIKDNKGKYYFIACGYYPEITRDTTVDLVRRGYQFMKSAGVATAVQAFNDEQDQDYRYGDLGIFVYDAKGKCLANGRLPDDVGHNQWNNKDEDGRFFVQEMIAQAQAGGGWVSFKINNSFQSAYVESVNLGVGHFIIGSGMYPVSKPETMRLLVKSAVGYLNGGHTVDELLQRLVNREDQFLRGDLFLYVFDLAGYCYGWGDSYQLIWKNLLEWKDEDGKPFVKLMIDSAQHGPDYLVLKMKKRQRVNYFETVQQNGKKYLIGSGFYK